MTADAIPGLTSELHRLEDEETQAWVLFIRARNRTNAIRMAMGMEPSRCDPRMRTEKGRIPPEMWRHVLMQTMRVAREPLRVSTLVNECMRAISPDRDRKYVQIRVATTLKNNRKVFARVKQGWWTLRGTEAQGRSTDGNGVHESCRADDPAA